MRERLQKILKGDEGDVFAESVLRPFWLLPKTLLVLGEPARANMTIVDLAQWARERGRTARK